ncbi:MAG: HAMP domain-containing histidine kinase [Ruminococcus sp.]|uniref:sensor histidine kinase n=1 Tax=Ruminococcus sp. TaxID=41978 RepID=UPI0025DB965A|nr:HAMP domain-containing sensor histidine kinase [Ruminococcus sp.]MBR5682758.1 HAMP domain-containing histidine kinase [Ruminococcus sp.]
MKNKLFKRKPKRTSFLKMFLKGMIIPIIITMIVGNYTSFFVKMQVYTLLENQADNVVTSYMRSIRRQNEQKKYLPKYIFLSMLGSIAPNTEGGYLDPVTWVEPKCRSVTFTVDTNGDIVDSCREVMCMGIRMSEAPDSTEYYVFDPQEYDIPELRGLFEEHLRDIESRDHSNELDITSLYINEKEKKMIPHTINVKRYRWDNGFLNYGYFDFSSVLEKEYTITVDCDVEGYVLKEIASRHNMEEYPHGVAIQGIYGCDPGLVDEIYGEYRDRIKEWLDRNSSRAVFNDMFDFGKNTDVAFERIYDDEEERAIISFIETDMNGLRSWRRMIFFMSLLFGCMTLFVLVVCLTRNAKNKAQYAFEDYQRALTNNLAHDLKTPLAVIGGYAENLIEMRKEDGSEKELNYLGSIMKNVAYTDDIIAKTLKLSETEQIKKLNKTKVDIKELAESAADKYRTVLEERGIELDISGGGEVSADRDILGTAVENLVSNAVKYTRNDGTIKITADKKRLCVVNDTAENVDTKDLLMPFVKGDKARSDKNSHGLGLAIAAAAAAQNGFRLKIDCRDKRFTAMIVF